MSSISVTQYSCHRIFYLNMNPIIKIFNEGLSSYSLNTLDFSINLFILWASTTFWWLNATVCSDNSIWIVSCWLYHSIYTTTSQLKSLNHHCYFYWRLKSNKIIYAKYGKFMAQNAVNYSRLLQNISWYINSKAFCEH